MLISDGRQGLMGGILGLFLILLTSLTISCQGKVVMTSVEDRSIETPTMDLKDYNNHNVEGDDLLMEENEREPYFYPPEQQTPYGAKQELGRNYLLSPSSTWSRFTPSQKLYGGRGAKNGYSPPNSIKNFMAPVPILPPIPPLVSASTGGSEKRIPHRLIMEKMEQQPTQFDLMPSSNIHHHKTKLILEQEPEDEITGQYQPHRVGNDVDGRIPNYLTSYDTSTRQKERVNNNYNYPPQTNMNIVGSSFVDGGGGIGGRGRHFSSFNAISPRKRQILFRQCFFNPISCF